jgi:hypothetical protein
MNVNPLGERSATLAPAPYTRLRRPIDVKLRWEAACGAHFQSDEDSWQRTVPDQANDCPGPSECDFYFFRESATFVP